MFCGKQFARTFIFIVGSMHLCLLTVAVCVCVCVACVGSPTASGHRVGRHSVAWAVQWPLGIALVCLRGVTTLWMDTWALMVFGHRISAIACVCSRSGSGTAASYLRMGPVAAA